VKAIIIDDEYWTRATIRRLVDWESFGIERVEEAEDGAGGLRLVEELQPDIVITDMKMRGMDGVELLKRLTENYPFIRKIVISGYDDFSFTKQAIVSKVDEYLLKPINPAELSAAIAKAVSEQKAAKGLYSAQPLEKTFVGRLAEYKNDLSRLFPEMQAGDVRRLFDKLGGMLEEHMPATPGTRNLVYKQLMLLLDEQATQAGIELSETLPADKAELFATDATPIRLLTDALADRYASVLEEMNERKKNRSRIDIDEVCRYIDRSYPEPHTLESIAGRFYVSREHLARLFKQEKGTTVMDYLAYRRIEEAKRLLQQSHLSAKSVGEAVGYADPAYFHRIFKKMTGVTPAQIKQDPEGSGI